jgi:aspartate aminotransferase-like enzyme
LLILEESHYAASEKALEAIQQRDYPDRHTYVETLRQNPHTPYMDLLMMLGAALDAKYC